MQRYYAKECSRIALVRSNICLYRTIFFTRKRRGQKHTDFQAILKDIWICLKLCKVDIKIIQFIELPQLLCIFSFRGWLCWQEWVWNKEVNKFSNLSISTIVQPLLLRQRRVCELARAPRELWCHMWLQGGIWQLEEILWWVNQKKSRTRETSTLSTDVDSRTNTNLKRLRDSTITK